MKEDYLWDKTGNDIEIENLENSLKTFRMQNPIPPELPAKSFEVDKSFFGNKRPGSSFRLAFAAFACLGLVIVSIGVFQILRTDNQDLAENSIQLISNEKEIEKPISVPVEVSNENEKASENKEIAKPKITKAKFTAKPKVKRQAVKAKKQVPARISNQATIAKQSRLKAVKNKPEAETVILTEEEQYAYDQLMTALAITSSKLKLVKDKVQGIE